MKIVRQFPLLGSSVDPEKLSLTVKGILGWVATGVVLIATLVGVSVSNEDLKPIIDGIGIAIVQIGGLISTGVAVYGAIRKVIVAFKNRKQ